MTLRWLLPSFLVILFAVAFAWAQNVLAPPGVALVCAYNSSPTTVTTGKFVYVQCDSSGHLAIAP